MSTTPNFGLAKPAHASQNWDTPLNSNFDLIDALGGGTAGQVLMSNGPNTPPAKRTPVNNETPAGGITGTNGSDGNAVFAVANNPFALFKLTKNGVEMYENVAYTRVNQQITYLAPYIPVVGDEHRASYIY